MKYFNYKQPQNVFVHQAIRARTSSFHDMCKLGLCHKTLDNSLYGSKWVAAVTDVYDAPRRLSHSVLSTLFPQRILDRLSFFVSHFFLGVCTFFGITVSSMNFNRDGWCDFPQNAFNKKDWEHFKKNGLNSARIRSQQLNTKLHIVLDHWHGLTDALGGKYGWDCGDSTHSEMILENLKEGRLVMNWVKCYKDEQISYTDDDVRRNDVIWGVDWVSMEHFVARIEIIVHIKGLNGLKDSSGQILGSYDGLPDKNAFFVCKGWHEVRDDVREVCKNNLDVYLDTLPLMHELEEDQYMITPPMILQRVHYSHAHSLVPEKIWEKLWRGGAQNWNLCEKRLAEFQKWKKQTKYWYKSAMNIAKIEDNESFPWCGTRWRCSKHSVLECEHCIGNNLPLTPVFHCENDRTYWVFGSPQGHINKFNMNGTRKR